MVETNDSHDCAQGHVKSLSTRHARRNPEGDMLHVDQEHDPTRMLERALNGARSCNHSSKPRAIVHRVIRDDVRVCQRDSSRYSFIDLNPISMGWCTGSYGSKKRTSAPLPRIMRMISGDLWRMNPSSSTTLLSFEYGCSTGSCAHASRTGRVQQRSARVQQVGACRSGRARAGSRRADLAPARSRRSARAPPD